MKFGFLGFCCGFAGIPRFLEKAVESWYTGVSFAFEV